MTTASETTRRRLRRSPHLALTSALGHGILGTTGSVGVVICVWGRQSACPSGVGARWRGRTAVLAGSNTCHRPGRNRLGGSPRCLTIGNSRAIPTIIAIVP